MRLTLLVSAAAAISVAAPVFAQEWVEFASREDRFTCLFPVQPKVTETTYLSQHEADLAVQKVRGITGVKAVRPLLRVAAKK